MSRISKLAGTDGKAHDIRSLEAEREALKMTVTFSPLAEFIVENIQHSASIRSKTAALRSLIEAAALDWLEAKGYTPDSPEFQAKYFAWLKGEHIGEAFDTGELEDHPTYPYKVPVMANLTHFEKVAL